MAFTAAPAAAAPDDTDRTLEVRIHGVKNTAPADMLDVPTDEVELTAGDALGSFWRPTAASRERTSRPPLAKDDLGPGLGDTTIGPTRVRGSVPEGIRREAYSWGGMVRTSPPGTGPGGVIIAGIGRACWTLLLPFSIANAAIWSWAMPQPAENQSTSIRFRAGVIRFACLLLTILFVLSLTSLAITVGALQCFRGGHSFCAPISEPLSFLEHWRDERRVALFSLLPIIGLLAVFIVGVISRLKYNVAGRIVKPGSGSPRVLLQHPQMWTTRRETGRLGQAHLSAGISIVALFCSLALWTTLPPWGWTLTALSVVCLLASAWIAARTDSLPFEKLKKGGEPVSRSNRSIAARNVLVLASVAYLLGAITLGFWGDRITVLRPEFIRTFDFVLLGVTFLALAAIVTTLFFRRPSPAYRAWRGFAPAVFLTMGLVVSLLFASLLNVVVGDWLNGDLEAQRLLRGKACTGTGCRPADVTIGDLYLTILGLYLVALVVILLIVVVILVISRKKTADRFAGWPDPSSGDLRNRLDDEVKSKQSWAARAHLVEPVVGITATLMGLATAAALVIAYRIEIIGLLRGWGVDLPEGVEKAFDQVFLRTWLSTSLTVWSAVGLALVAGLVLGGTSAGRPFALVWDLACFLPRSGHPLGAPCYTERAVPEVARRVRTWLDATPADRGPTPGTPGAVPAGQVVLSAHSMGAVVAVSAIFMLSTDEAWESDYRRRVSLLTFGVQLRPYFGRFFPEILGPGVLGQVPARPPRLRSGDPWENDWSQTKNSWKDRGKFRPATADAQAAAAAFADDAPLATVPVKGWISLWRPTDYLGFPAYANRSPVVERKAPATSVRNPRDRVVEQIDVTGYLAVVDMHSWYYRAATYATAMDELLAEPAEEAPGADGDGRAD